jgi:hypothetical protein
MFYSISIRVIIIYRLIQELGSIGMILGIAIGLHLHIWPESIKPHELTFDIVVVVVEYCGV